MLPNTLNTNEVKNAAGVEQEFQRLSPTPNGTEFGLITELPYLPHRLKIDHQLIGTGVKQRRRSRIRFEKSSVSGVDATQVIQTSCNTVLDHPVGLSANNDAAKEVLANMMSFLATTGAGTTVLFDCSGNGAQTLLTGGL